MLTRQHMCFFGHSGGCVAYVAKYCRIGFIAKKPMSSQTRFRTKSSRIHHVKLAKRVLLKARSLDNAIQEISLASPSWNLNQNTMLYTRTRNIMGRSYFFFSLFFFILGTRACGYGQLISSMCSWNNC